MQPFGPPRRREGGGSELRLGKPQTPQHHQCSYTHEPQMSHNEPEDWERAMDGAKSPDPREDPLVDVPEPKESTQAESAHTAKIIGRLTPDRVREINDRMEALRMGGHSNANKSVFHMKRLAESETDFWAMLESYDVDLAANRKKHWYGKTVEAGISHQKFADAYERDFLVSNTSAALEARRTTHGPYETFASERRNQSVNPTAYARGEDPKYPTEDEIKAEWDSLPATQRNKQVAAATETLAERIEFARKTEKKYGKALKFIVWHFPHRGEYMESVAPINDILSGKKATRPAPALAPRDTCDDSMESMRQAQAKADQAAAERDRIQPNSNEWRLANAKWRCCNRHVADLAARAEALQPTPKPKLPTAKQLVLERTERLLAQCLDFGTSENGPVRAPTAVPPSAERVEDLAKKAEEEEEVEVNARVVAFNHQREAKKVERKTVLQLREQLIAQYEQEYQVAAEKKAVAARYRAAVALKHRKEYAANRDTLLGFELQSRDIALALGKSALANFPKGIGDKRKNKPEATIEQPSGGAGVIVVSSNQTKRTKTS